MTSTISQSGAVVTVDLGGVTFPGDAKDQNTQAFTIGGTNKPLIQVAIPGTSASVTAPEGYGGEPVVVYINGYKLESGTLDAAAVASIGITAPAAGATITASGTATAKVYDQYGAELTDETVTWASSSDSTMTINASTGAYSPVRDGSVTITATSTTDNTKTGTASVTVDVS